MTRTTTDRATNTAVVAGVDTHKDTHHVAVLATSTGARLGDLKVPATPAGYEQLLGFVTSFGTTVLIGVEGTNSYGAGLARYLDVNLNRGFIRCRGRATGLVTAFALLGMNVRRLHK